LSTATPVRRRTRARELALQFLYALELRGAAALEELEAFVDHHTKGGPDPKGREEIAAYAKEICHGVHEHRPEIDAWIEAIAENWRLARMAAVDRNVLRLATFELLHKPDVPYKVAINEAIDMAKRYSTAQSGAFVNGILDRTWVLVERGRASSAGAARPPPGGAGGRGGGRRPAAGPGAAEGPGGRARAAGPPPPPPGEAEVRGVRRSPAEATDPSQVPGGSAGAAVAPAPVPRPGPRRPRP
jgi:N utilization substance protein B